MVDGELMSIEYIRKTYNVPAKIGGRIEYKSRPGTIVGACSPERQICCTPKEGSEV